MQKGMVLFVLTLASSLWATDQMNFIPVKTRTAQQGLLHWERAEAYRDRHPSFGKEKIVPIARFTNPQVTACFPDSLYEGETADASLMVLLYAPQWDLARKTPVLLVHGAGDDAFRAWTHPLSLTTPQEIPKEKEGFMQKLTRAGYPVFAINFSHSHGCNYRQAEQIHNAIQVIKDKTGAQKVHLIAHSKGNAAASIYVCGGREVSPEVFSFLSPFKKDVAAYVQIAPANKGIDLIFRYYTGSVYTLSNKLPSPVCFHSAVIYGTWRNFYKEDIYRSNPGMEVGNYFPGQCQLVYNLVDDGLDFSVYSYTPVDMNMTMRACYYGGTTMFVSAYGVEHAEKEGHYTISTLNRKGIDPSVQLVNMYGTNSVIQEIEIGFIKVPIGVPDHPSDGLVYVHSASYLDGMLSRGARRLGQRGFDKNHFGLAIHPDAFEWMAQQLQKAE